MIVLTCKYEKQINMVLDWFWMEEGGLGKQEKIRPKYSDFMRKNYKQINTG